MIVARWSLTERVERGTQMSLIVCDVVVAAPLTTFYLPLPKPKIGCKLQGWTEITFPGSVNMR